MKDSDEELHVGGLYTRLFVDRADLLVLPDHGDNVVIDGVTYTLFEPKIDATHAHGTAGTFVRSTLWRAVKN